MSYNLSTGNEYADSIFSDVAKTFITNTLQRNNLITTGTPKTGNLSAAQLQAGQVGQVPQGPSANNVGVLNSLGFNAGGTSTYIMYGVGAILVLGLVYFAVKK